MAITVGATDNESGMPNPIVYKVYVKESTQNSYPSSPNKTETSTNIIIDGLTVTSQYDIKVTTEDIAGNIGEKELKGIGLNTAPRFTANGAGTATGNTTMTITATATDNEQDTLTYTLNYGTTSSYGKTKTLSKAKGQQASFSLTASDGLSNYSLWYWRIDVTDGVVTESVKGTSGSTRTWCNLASYCTGYNYSSRTCSSCSGSGGRYVNCSSCGGSGTKTTTTNCSSCSGSGQRSCSGFFTLTRSHQWGPCSIDGKTMHVGRDYACSTCGASYYRFGGCSPVEGSDIGSATHSKITCSSCSGTGKNTTSTKCSSCSGSGDRWSSCSSCSGSGSTSIRVNCSHGYSSSHYYCSSHSKNSSSGNQYHQ